MKLAGRDLVSVVIPTYNRSKLIGRALKSVWGQTYRPLEVVVVDDGSTDDTETVVNCWAKEWAAPDFELRYCRQLRGGVSAARNRGILEAQGDYLQFLDSDDEILPTKIAGQVAALTRAGADYAVGITEFIGRSGHVSGRTTPWLASTKDCGRQAYYSEPLWHVNAVLYRRHVCELLPPWETGLIAGEDQLYACRLKLSRFRGVVLDTVSDRVYSHGLGSATTPLDGAALVRYSESFGVACEGMFKELQSMGRLCSVERVRLARYAVANAVRLSREGERLLVLAAIRQAAKFAPWYIQPFTWWLFGLVALPGQTKLLHGLWRLSKRIARTRYTIG